VLIDGALMAWLDRSARRLWTFGSEAGGESLDAEQAAQVAQALHGLFRQRDRAVLRIEAIDGVEATLSPLAEAFVRAGFRRGYKGLELERSGAGLG
jgi:hypothetical protein